LNKVVFSIGNLQVYTLSIYLEVSDVKMGQESLR
jgi:hypothetical protein